MELSLFQDMAPILWGTLRMLGHEVFKPVNLGVSGYQPCCFVQTWGIHHGKFDWNHDNQPWGDMRCPISSHTCYILLQYVWGGHYPAMFALDFKLILGYTDRNQRPPQSVLSTPGDPSRPWNFHRFFCMGIQSPQFCDPSNNEGLIKNHKVSQSSRSPTRPLPRAHQPSMKYYWWVIFGRLNPIVSSDSWWLITSVV